MIPSLTTIFFVLGIVMIVIVVSGALAILIKFIYDSIAGKAV